jgi:hypothetical protein
MTAFRVLVVVALLSASAGTPAFARASEGHFRYNSISSELGRAGMPSRSWCLHNYADDYVDCSYSNRSQCAATAAGGLGQCSLNPQ